MANINVRREAESQIVPTQNIELEPFRVMRDLLSWDPFRDIRAFEPFRQMRGLNLQQEMAFAPAFEVKETKDSYYFKADVPGVKESDIDVSLTGDRLSITGKRDMEVSDKGDTWYTYERNYGSFTRSFTLPIGVDIDHARAEVKEGVLTLVLPKLAEAVTKKIAVKSGEKSKA
jgi:HSP20 family protein